MAKITKHGGPSDGSEQVAVDEDQAELDVTGHGADHDPDTYDPGDYTVAEVSAYLDQCVDDGNLDEARRVLRAERTDQGGKGRAGILNRVI